MWASFFFLLLMTFWPWWNERKSPLLNFFLRDRVANFLLPDGGGGAGFLSNEVEEDEDEDEDEDDRFDDVSRFNDLMANFVDISDDGRMNG